MLKNKFNEFRHNIKITKSELEELKYLGVQNKMLQFMNKNGSYGFDTAVQEIIEAYSDKNQNTPIETFIEIYDEVKDANKLVEIDKGIIKRRTELYKNRYV